MSWCRKNDFQSGLQLTRQLTNRKRKYTYLCPISCAIVKAEPRPISSLILQLLSGSHIPATDAKPGHTHTERESDEVMSRCRSATLSHHHKMRFFTITSKPLNLKLVKSLCESFFKSL